LRRFWNGGANGALGFGHGINLAKTHTA
jgi:hypothetical protein